MAAKNGAEKVEINFDVDVLRAELGIDELEAKMAEALTVVGGLQASLAEWLVYLNLMDERIQALSGEPVVSATLSASTGKDGSIALQKHRPPIPASLLNAQPPPVKSKRLPE